MNPGNALLKLKIRDTVNCLRGLQADLAIEKRTQAQVFEAVRHLGFVREYRLNANNIPDLFCIDLGLAIEIKIKGAKKAIYQQCLRYCGFEQVQALILITGKAVGLPGEILGKPCFYISLGKAYL
jgi:hypothetical protein